VRIAVFPKGQLDALTVERSMSVFDWIERARRLPADGLELPSGVFDRVDDGYLDDVGAALERAGFEMPMLCAAPDFTNPDPEVRQREIEHEADMMRITARLGGPRSYTRVLSGQRHPGVADEQGLDWATEAITGLLPLARELDLTLTLENHYKASSWRYPEFAQRREAYLALLDRIDDRQHFGVQFDPSNAVVAGDDPVDLLETVVDRVVSMQASDRSLAPGTTLDELRQADGTIGYSPALQHGVLGEGLNDYPRIFTVLADAGYDGWISIEDGVNGMDDLAASVDFLQRAREEYFGGSTAVSVRSHPRNRGH
jgi:sugar phosphate isomerase/epimerase